MTPLMVVLILVGCVVPSSAHEVFVALSDVNHGAYRLEGHFVVEAPRHVVWEVLTDYDHIREFVSSIRTSQVKQRDKDWRLLEQDAVGRVLFFGRRFSVLLAVREQPLEQILFEDISHKDFEFYAGSWQIQDVPEELLVLYRLTSKSRFSGPGFLEKRSVKKTVRGLLEEVREEILRRALEGARSSGGVRTEVRSQIGGLTSLPNVEGRGVEVPSLVLHASPRQGDQETWQLCVKRLVMKPPCCGACPSLTILEC